MPAHDHFLELGTLAAIGQISESEDRELREHWAQCQECRDAYSDYSSILNNYLPNLNPVRFRLKKEFTHPSTAEDIRSRFIARAKDAGAEFSAEVETKQKKDYVAGIRWERLCWISAAAAMASIAIWAAASVRLARPLPSSEVAALTKQNQSLWSALSAAKADGNHIAVSAQSDEQLIKQEEERIAVLQKQLAGSSDRVKSLETQLAQLSSLNVTLAADRQKKEQSILDLQVQLNQEKNVSVSALAALVEAQDKIHNLNATVAEGAERLSMERQLASVSSDVRQLMGARNLHIIDVHDVNPSGKTNKSFGRVFYAEREKLVFYAFDLPSSKSARYYFQAWGQTEGDERSVRNIGTFSVDDHEQRRWVLKVNDPALLKGIDSVFVTAETTGDHAVPKGKRVLYAYFAGQANHP